MSPDGRFEDARRGDLRYGEQAMAVPTTNSLEGNAMGQLDRTGGVEEIFIVDDDYDMREALSAIFRKEGYRTAAFADGRSFVRLARGQRPACVLLDLCMPDLSGLEVLKELDARNYPAPVLIVFRRKNVLNVVQAMRHGAFDYLEKRLDAGAIVTRVVEAIELWKQLRERDESRRSRRRSAVTMSSRAASARRWRRSPPRLPTRKPRGTSA